MDWMGIRAVNGTGLIRTRVGIYSFVSSKVKILYPRDPYSYILNRSGQVMMIPRLVYPHTCCDTLNPATRSTAAK